MITTVKSAVDRIVKGPKDELTLVLEYGVMKLEGEYRIKPDGGALFDAPADQLYEGILSDLGDPERVRIEFEVLPTVSNVGDRVLVGAEVDRISGTNCPDDDGTSILVAK